MPMPLTILFFITCFLAIFTPCVAYIRKSEERNALSVLLRQRLRYKRAESDSAWILNRRLME
jgi:hypothetical protein